MKINKILIAVMLLSLGATAFFYGKLPEEIALHYNYLGEVDRWGSRIYIWLTGSLPLIMYAIMVLVPKIDPRKDSYEKHGKAYSILSVALILFLMSMHWFTIAVSLGVNLNIKIFILVALGILWIILGNYLPNARQNYTFGIKTPWTLADETSWTKTHRVGGIAFVCLGVFALFSAFLPGLTALVIFVGGNVLMAIGLTVYSYSICKKSRT